MELQWKHVPFSSLAPVVSRVQNSEQTQELRLGEGMPDVARVIGAWGQPVLRSKEWRSDWFSYSGGMLVWVLYEPEGDEGLQVLSSWIPFQLRWELPPDTPEGQIRFTGLPRYVDARSVSPRKIMVRCGMAVLGEAYVKENSDIYTPEQADHPELLVKSYPLTVVTEMGEKSVQLDEELSVPEGEPRPVRIVSCTVDPVVQENRLLSDKLVFRGEVKMHLLCISDSGQLRGWDFALPFSQYAQLDRTYTADSAGDIRVVPAALEPELTADGQLRVKCTLVGQYLIADTETVSLAEDAYSPQKELLPEKETAAVAVVLDRGSVSLSPRREMDQETELVVDARFLPDYPIEESGEKGKLRFPGCFQILYYDRSGKLHSTALRVEEESEGNTLADALWSVYPGVPDVQTVMGSGSLLLKTEMKAEYLTQGRQDLNMITRVQEGKERIPDPDRPSVVICRCEGQSLWELAKEHGSTQEAIRRVNSLEGECTPGQLLMIPIL